jgi:hypothetical protein
MLSRAILFFTVFVVAEILGAAQHPVRLNVSDRLVPAPAPDVVVLPLVGLGIHEVLLAETWREVEQDHGSVAEPSAEAARQAVQAEPVLLRVHAVEDLPVGGVYAPAPTELRPELEDVCAQGCSPPISDFSISDFPI